MMFPSKSIKYTSSCVVSADETTINADNIAIANIIAKNFFIILPYPFLLFIVFCYAALLGPQAKPPPIQSFNPSLSSISTSASESASPLAKPVFLFVPHQPHTRHPCIAAVAALAYLFALLHRIAGL